MNPFMAHEEAKEIAEVNVVPLADVSLVLLIILLLLSPMMAQSSMKVKSAGSDSSAPAPQPEPLVPQTADLVLVVNLDEKGLTLGGQVYDDPGSFMTALRDALAAHADKKVFLAPGPDVPHGLVVHTLETIKSCGAETVALVQTQETTENHGPLLPAETAR
jgi:biopolymer transport protein TolR